jgi:uncharacterized protein
MHSRICKAFSLNALGLLVLACGACFWALPLPPADRLARLLSFAVLQPEITCTQLRNSLQLEDLPVVETPADLGVTYDSDFVLAPNGNPLHIWYMPVADARGAVIVSSGNTGTMACYQFTAYLLTRAGYSTVMYDYEGFGASDGSPALGTLRDDLEAVLDWTRATTGQDAVSLFGISLGSIPTIAVAVDRPDAVNAVVLDSPVAMVSQIERFSGLVGGRTQQVLAALAPWPWLLTEDVIGGMRQPLLVFVHELDSVTPPSTIAMLLANTTCPKTTVLFTGLGHAAGQFRATAEYTAQLTEFLADAWPPSVEVAPRPE